MPRRKTNLGRHTRNTEGAKRKFSNMTEEERASVRERNKLSVTPNQQIVEQQGLRMLDCEHGSHVLQQQILFRIINRDYECRVKRSRIEPYFTAGYCGPWEIVPNKDPNPGPYYGIDGIERISNTQLAVALILLGFFGAILGFASVKYSVAMNTQQLDEKSAKAGAIHASVRADAQKFGNEEQLRRVLNKLLKEDR